MVGNLAIKKGFFGNILIEIVKEEISKSKKIKLINCNFEHISNFIIEGD